MNEIIKKMKKAGLKGRSGGGFPTALKWEIFKKQRARKKYIICNAAEGEPGVIKDGYILEKFPQVVVEGIKIALRTFKNSNAFIYLKEDYYQRFKENLQKIILGLPISLFCKKGGYLAGEESVILNVIEGKDPEPRIKPPFPLQVGLWGCPTLINNVETFYYIAKINRGEYNFCRFYSISGEAKNKGVFELPENYSIEQILKETGNFPGFDFFVQAGGGAVGEILLPHELNQPVRGSGAIIIYNKKKTDPFDLLKKWASFFMQENCDRCLPCREGIFRIWEMIENKKLDKENLDNLFFVLENTSFCGLGRSASIPFKSLIQKLNLLENNEKKKN